VTRPARTAGLLVGVFVVALALGWAATSFLGPLIPTRAPDPATRPTPHPFAPLILDVSSAADSPARISLASDADCSAVAASQKLFDICSLAVNADPAVIGGAAFGRLNSEDTPSYDALVWRARANGDPKICAAGGLLEPRLSQCRAAAIDPEYSMTDSGLTVVVLPGP
jgi:hypothetical protein